MYDLFRCTCFLGYFNLVTQTSHLCATVLFHAMIRKASSLNIENEGVKITVIPRPPHLGPNNMGVRRPRPRSFTQRPALSPYLLPCSTRDAAVSRRLGDADNRTLGRDNLALVIAPPPTSAAQLYFSLFLST